MFRPANHAGGVGGHDLPEDQPIEEHTDGSELEFDGGRGDPVLQRFDIRRDVDGLHIPEVCQASGLTPCGEFSCGFGVGFPCIGFRILAAKNSNTRLAVPGSGEKRAGSVEPAKDRISVF